jgi:Protein of unknown function (DUF2934)
MSTPKPNKKGRKAGRTTDIEAPIETSTEGPTAGAAVTLRGALGDGAGDLHDAIQERAYHIFLSRGNADGNELADWLEAERSVRSRSERAAHPLSSNERR